MSGIERDTVCALLQIQRDLERLLAQKPETDEERRAWCDGVSTALLEMARGRVFLQEHMAREAESGTAVLPCEGQDILGQGHRIEMPVNPWELERPCPVACEFPGGQPPH